MIFKLTMHKALNQRNGKKPNQDKEENFTHFLFDRKGTSRMTKSFFWTDLIILIIKCEVIIWQRNGHK